MEQSSKGVKAWPVLALLFMATFFLQACCPPQRAGQGAEISILYHGKLCRSDVSVPLVTWFGQSADFQGLDDNFLKGLDSSVLANLMSFDFSDYGILLLSPGTRGPQTFDIRLNDTILDIVDSTALLHLKLIRKIPEAEKEENESCTPSVLLKVPKGDYHHIQACDERGLFMVKIRIPEN